MQGSRSSDFYTVDPNAPPVVAYGPDPVRAMQLLREKRNQLLQESDRYVLPDYPHSSELIRNAWFAYRQQLRDLPSNSTPSILSDGSLNPESVCFPTPPH